jgi:transposase-like protein
MEKCPECGSEVRHHRFNGRVYYVCKRCRKEFIIPEMSII